MTTNILALLLLLAGVLLDLAANIFLKKSEGFRRRRYGAAALICVTLAFICIAGLIQIMDLSVAYSLFGALGLILTTTVDARFFGLHINRLGIGGLITMIAGVVLIKMV